MARRSIYLLAMSLLFGCGRSEVDLLTAGVDAGKDAPEPCAGHAALFNGAAYLSLARPVADDFTLEAWIKTRDSRSGTTFYNGSGVIYADAPPGSNPLGANDFGSSILNDKFAFGVGNPDTTLESITKVTTGEWIHVAATRSKTTGESRVLVNGVLEGSVTTTQKGSLTDQAILMIGNTTVDDLYYVGVMDEIRVWDTVLGAKEIAEAMHHRLSGTEPGLVGYWQFDDVDGTVAIDSSDGNTDATSGLSNGWRRMRQCVGRSEQRYGSGPLRKIRVDFPAGCMAWNTWTGMGMAVLVASCQLLSDRYEKEKPPEPKLVPAHQKVVGPRPSTSVPVKEPPFVGEAGTDAQGYPLQRPDRVALLNLLRLRRFDLLERFMSFYQDQFEQDFRKEWWPDDAVMAFFSDDPALTPLLDEWVAKSGMSFAAWAARGNHHAQLMTGAPVHGRAVADLKKAVTLRPRFVAGYVRLIGTRNAGDASDDELRGMLDAAVKVCPLCYSVRAAYLATLQPRWGGSWNQMSQFASSLQPLVDANPKLAFLGGFRSSDQCNVLGWGQSKNEEKDLAGAHAACDTALRFGDDPTFLVEKADLLKLENRYGEALPFLDRALGVSPHHGEALQRRHFVRWELGDIIGSGRDMVLARHLDPTDEWLAKRVAGMLKELQEAGSRLSKSGKNAEAAGYFQLGLELAPGDHSLAQAQGFNAADDIDRLRAEAATRPDDFELHLRIDRALGFKKRHAEVVEMWDGFIAKHADDPRPYMERGTARWHLRNFPGVISDTQKACDLGLKKACSYLPRFKATLPNAK